MVIPRREEMSAAIREFGTDEDRRTLYLVDQAIDEIDAMLANPVAMYGLRPETCRKFVIADGYKVCTDPTCDTHPKPEGWVDSTSDLLAEIERRKDTPLTVEEWAAKKGYPVSTVGVDMDGNWVVWRDDGTIGGVPRAAE